MMSAPGFFSRFVGVTELARDTAMFTAANPPNPAVSDARNIGSATATREVYALIFAAAAAARTLDAVTIGGVAATIHDATGGSSGLVCAIASANVPTGTTAVVSCTFSGVLTDFACCVIALDGLNSATPVDTDGDASSFATATTEPTDFPSAGYAMAIAGAIPMTGVSPSCVWSGGGLAEVFDGSIVNGASRAGVTMAVNPTTVASSGTTVSAAFSHAATLTLIVLVTLK